MKQGIVKKLPKLLLDTNILISALVYGGKPEQIYNLVLEKQIIAITSNTLIAEAVEILTQKFSFERKRVEQFNKIIRKHFVVVYPKISINLVRDKDDNRVLEAAAEGQCQHIITGDKDLLDLGLYKKIKILPPEEFLSLFENEES